MHNTQLIIIKTKDRMINEELQQLTKLENKSMHEWYIKPNRHNIDFLQVLQSS